MLSSLLTAGDAAIGLTFDALATELGFAERTMRRALRELESAGYVRCARRADKRKFVLCVTADDDVQALVALAMRGNVLKTAQQRPENGPTTARKRPNNGPKTAHAPTPQASIEPLINQGSGEAKRPSAARKRARGTPPPPRQQLLVSEGMETQDDRARVADALRRLDEVIRRVWERKGRTHGYLACDDKTMVGLAAALRRYPWQEIADCVAWSAERVADGKLKGAFFATTFRGAAFDHRHHEWLEALEREQRQALRAAEAHRQAMEHAAAAERGDAEAELDDPVGDERRDRMAAMGEDLMASWRTGG